jgi:hypothetical protein
MSASRSLIVVSDAAALAETALARLVEPMARQVLAKDLLVVGGAVIRRTFVRIDHVDVVCRRAGIEKQAFGHPAIAQRVRPKSTHCSSTSRTMSPTPRMTLIPLSCRRRRSHPRFNLVRIDQALCWLPNYPRSQRRPDRQRVRTRSARFGLQPAAPPQSSCECPLWVKSRHVQRKRSCPLYPRKRTCAVQLGMSAMDPIADSCSAAEAMCLFDDLICGSEQRRRDIQGQ